MPSVLAIAAHPDDIEFVMAGTMLRLRDLGWDLHYMNIADGCRGSMETNKEETAAIRLVEAKRAAEMMGAAFYPPLCRDMEVIYSPELLRRVAAVVRMARADVVLTHSPSDYMEDHEQACKLAVSAAFCHTMPNQETEPPTDIYTDPVTVYHAQPHGNCTPLCEPITPGLFVDCGDVVQEKREILAAHTSQKEWLDKSQGMDSYLQTMLDQSLAVGKMSGRFEHAEGWRRHLHWGFCGPDDDPLAELFGGDA
ncbi:MAG: PIG-L family deacetylase [Planctomycetota bacterium]